MRATRKGLLWISIASIAFGSMFIRPVQQAKADLWGGDVVVLTKILVETIKQVAALHGILSQARQTVSILEEMNRGVKEVIRIAETAHVPLPPQVYDQAKQIDRATEHAKRIYGILPEKSPRFTKTHYRSGVEGLHLSQDAFDYSTFLDEQGKRVKSASIVANQATATRLSAQTLGVLLHAVSHSNRIQAKTLEISSTERIENATKENSQFESFVQTHEAIERGMKEIPFSPLNSFSGSGDRP